MPGSTLSPASAVPLSFDIPMRERDTGGERGNLPVLEINQPVNYHSPGITKGL